MVGEIWLIQNSVKCVKSHEQNTITRLNYFENLSTSFM